jgi:hypothetical protein
MAITVSSDPGIMLGYYRMPEANAESFRAGTDSDRVEKKKLIAEVTDLRLNSYDRVDRLWR